MSVMNQQQEAINLMDLDTNENKTAGRWTNEEHQLFLNGLKTYQKQWKNIADLVKTRTVVQVRTHAQKYFQKLEKGNGKGLNKFDENGSSTEIFSGEGGEESNFSNYRANSVSSTDSFDGNTKLGRSISIGSDGGNTDTDFEKFGHRSPAARSMSVGSFQGEMMMLKLSGSSNNLLSKTKSLNNSANRSAVPKKRSRDISAKSAPLMLRVSSQSALEPPVKSPKRSYHKQQPNSVKSSVQQSGRQVEERYRGSYLDMTFPLERGVYGSESNLNRYGGATTVDQAHQMGDYGLGPDDLDMVSLLDNIDWGDVPAFSPASSPFTDSAASLSSSSDGQAAQSRANIISQCLGGSPLSFPHQQPQHQQGDATGEGDREDLFGVFDAFYGDQLLPASGHQTCPSVDAFTSAVMQQQQTAAAARDIKEVNRLYNMPVAALPKKDPQMHCSRVWFSSHVIDELKKKTAKSAGDVGPNRHSFLRPVRRDPDPLVKLPPLHTLKADAPPVVIRSQSLTLFDSTFSNYPLLLSDNSSGSNVAGDFNFGTDYSLLSGAAEEQKDHRLHGGRLALQHPQHQAGMLVSPASLSNSPAAKKRGRPKKGAVSQPCSPMVTSKSFNNLQQQRSGSLSDNTFMLRHQQQYANQLQPHTMIASQPRFPLMTSLREAPPRGQQLNELDALLVRYVECEAAGFAGPPHSAVESSLFPTVTTDNRQLPSTSSSHHHHHHHQQQQQFFDPFEFDGPCNESATDLALGADDPLYSDTLVVQQQSAMVHQEEVPSKDSRTVPMESSGCAEEDLAYDDLLCAFE